MYNLPSILRSVMVTLGATLFTCVGNPCHASLEFSHSGSADPTTEGWTTRSGGNTAPVSVGSITNDVGSGFDAWFVDDNSTAGGTVIFYEQTLSASQINQASTLGWTLRTRLRVVDNDDNPGLGSVFAEYDEGSTEYVMLFGSEADGDPIVVLFDGTVTGTSKNGPSFTLENSGGGYHLYELTFDPVSNSTDLFVDGIERISDYTGIASSDPHVAFGAGASADMGQGNYNLVEFSVVPESNVIPEPTTFIVWSLLGLSAVVVKSRRNRQA